MRAAGPAARARDARDLDPAPGHPLDLLTPVERVVFVAVATGMSVRDIALAMGYAETHTLSQALRRAKAKLSRVVAGRNYGAPDVLGGAETPHFAYRVRGVDGEDDDPDDA